MPTKGEAKMSSDQRLFSITHWLLKAATVLCVLLMGLLAVVLGGILLTAVGLLHFDLPVNDMPTGMQNFPAHQLLLVAAFALLIILVCLALVALMFVMAMRIVESTKAGNAFVIENAVRLAQIGWLLVAVQVVGFIANLMISFLPEKVSEHVSVGFDFSPVGVLAALMIFVLAQIFRHGAEMRAELEGMV